MLNFTRLLYSSLDSDRFDNHIEPIDWQQAMLERAKNDIRDHLRPRIKAATVAVLGMERAVEPKFRSQGSQRYKTCLRPVQPSQEMDWDFGVYLPVKVWISRGSPKVTAKLYFQLVERLLKELCDERGWALVSGKKSCVRVQIATWGHVDLPLYAVSEAEFDRVRERALAKSLDSTGQGSLESNVDTGELVEQEWDELADIAMATRNGEWVETDPEAVTRWYFDRVAEHGPQLRRICRFMKAWRDHQWESGGPTSVSLMIAVAKDFELCNRRDDLALEKAARALAVALRGEIREVAIDDGKDDFNRLDEKGRGEAASKAAALAEKLERARLHRVGEESSAIALVAAQLGERIPDRTDLVEPDRSDDSVRTVPASTVVPPMVPTTRAGKAG